MTLIVSPIRRFPLSTNGSPLHVIPAPRGHGLYIECEVVHPESTKGRKATLWIPPELADDMLRELRQYGIDRRR